ncbi:MAG: hypothetical protein U9N49_08285 [Campylobacterota bacterium]|nr:hypothetical protein [Campylobacterota bacterium]
MKINTHFALFFAALAAVILSIIAFFSFTQKEKFLEKLYHEIIGYNYYINYDTAKLAQIGKYNTLKSKLQSYCNTLEEFKDIYILDEKCNIMQSSQSSTTLPAKVSCHAAPHINTLSASHLLSQDSVRSTFYNPVTKQKNHIIIKLDQVYLQSYVFSTFYLPLIELFGALIFFFLIGQYLLWRFLTNPLEKYIKSAKEATNELNEAQSLTKLGSWSLDIQNNHLNWSQEIYRISAILTETNLQIKIG